MEQTTEEKATIKKQVARQTAGYILTALGLVVGLAWNDTVRSAIESIFPLDGAGLLAKFIYAIVITVVVIFVIRLTNRFLEDKA